MTTKRYFTRKTAGDFDYYVVNDSSVQVFYNNNRGWQPSIFSLDALSSGGNFNMGRVVEYSVEEFVLLCPHVLP